MSNVSTYPLGERHFASRAANPAAPGLSLIGALFVYATPLFSVIRCIPGLGIGGLNLAGWIWSGLLLMGLCLFCCHYWATPLSKIPQPVRGWLPWVGIIWASLLWCDDPAFRTNVQPACQFSMPVIIALISSTFIRTADQLRRMLRAYYWTLVPLGVIVLATRAGVLVIAGSGNRDAALTVALIGCIFLSRLTSAPLIGYCGWFGCLCMILLSSSRMALAALVVAILFHPAMRGIGRRLLAVSAMALCALAVFFSPTFQARTFYQGSGSFDDFVQGDGVDTAGRAEAWPLILEEAWKRPLLGSGVGTSSAFVEKVWEGVSHPHNDYLRVMFDCGLIGLAIYLAAVFWQVWNLRRMIVRSQGLVQQTFVAAFLGFLVLLITSASDNTLLYNVTFMDPLFALMGAAYGVAASEAAASSSLNGVYCREESR